MYNIDQKVEYLGKEYVVLVKMFKNESRDCNQYILRDINTDEFCLVTENELNN